MAVIQFAIKSLYGEVPEQAPIREEISRRLRFSLTDFLAERGVDIIPATIGVP
jgi:hypothetical protein